MRVVDDEAGLGDAVAQMHDFDVPVGGSPDTLIAVLAEDERLAVFELDDVFAAGVFFGDAGPGAVIEDVAVLQDFDEGGAPVRGGLLESVLQMSLEDIDRSGDER